MKKYNKQGGH